jgi:hypothetical protein
MDDTRWDELDHLGQKMALLNRLLDRAEEYGDQVQTQRLEAEIAKAKDLRHGILMSIAEASISA